MRYALLIPLTVLLAFVTACDTQTDTNLAKQDLYAEAGARHNELLSEFMTALHAREAEIGRRLTSDEAVALAKELGATRLPEAAEPEAAVEAIHQRIEAAAKTGGSLCEDLANHEAVRLEQRPFLRQVCTALKDTHSPEKLSKKLRRIADRATEQLDEEGSTLINLVAGIADSSVHFWSRMAEAYVDSVRSDGLRTPDPTEGAHKTTTFLRMNLLEDPVAYRQCVCQSCCYIINQHAWDMVSADASVGGVWFAMNAIKYGLVLGPWGIAQAYGEAWIAGGLASAIDYGMAYAEYAFGDPDLKWQCDNAWDWGDAYCDCFQR